MIYIRYSCNVGTYTFALAFVCSFVRLQLILPDEGVRAKRITGALGEKSSSPSHLDNYFSKSSYFLGDPPPDPRFLASLGALSPVEPSFMERTLLVELHKLGLSRLSLVCLPMNAMHPIGGSYNAMIELY
jgi:hypothetical protein